MTTIEERSEYLNNPFFSKHIYGNYTPFYVTIGICSVILGVIFILNIVLGCCSKHRYYWQDRHTGNRWLVSIWSATPHKQPPLDLTELQDVSTFQPFRPQSEEIEYQKPINEPRGYGRQQYFHQQLHQLHHQQQQQQFQHHHQPHHQPEEYVELHKRESDI